LHREQLSRKISTRNQLNTKVEEFISSDVMTAFSTVTLGGLVVSMLATGLKVRGFKPGRGRWVLRVIKSVARLSSEGK
jgi:molybdopterin-binding protein